MQCKKYPFSIFTVKLFGTTIPFFNVRLDQEFLLQYAFPGPKYINLYSMPEYSHEREKLADESKILRAISLFPHLSHLLFHPSSPARMAATDGLL